MQRGRSSGTDSPVHNYPEYDPEYCRIVALCTDQDIDCYVARVEDLANNNREKHGWEPATLDKGALADDFRGRRATSKRLDSASRRSFINRRRTRISQK